MLQLAIVADSFPSASFLHGQAHPCVLGLCAGRMRYGGRLPTIYHGARARRRPGTSTRCRSPTTGAAGGRSDLVWTRDEPPFLPQPPLVAVPPAFLPLPDAAAPAEEDTSGTRDGEFGRP